jgi:hypothetical protein
VKKSKGIILAVHQQRPTPPKLFVGLASPATPVQLEGLPENVVHIVHTSQNTTCILPTDQELKIIREQVEVMPNFPMTDYGSQECTHPNVMQFHC